MEIEPAIPPEAGQAFSLVPRLRGIGSKRPVGHLMYNGVAAR